VEDRETTGSFGGVDLGPEPTRQEALELLKHHPLRPGGYHGKKPPKAKGYLPMVDEGPGWLTRNELKALAQITESEFLKLVHRRILVATARSKTRSWSLYKPEDVDLARTAVNEYARLEAILQRDRAASTPRRGRPPHDPGQPPQRDVYKYKHEEFLQAARLLRQGVSREVICIETEIHPDTLYKICRDYDRLTGGFFLDGPSLAAINACEVEGFEMPVRGPQALAALVTFLTREKRCRACGKAGLTGTCLACIRAKLVPKKVGRPVGSPTRSTPRGPRVKDPENADAELVSAGEGSDAVAT